MTEFKIRPATIDDCPSLANILISATADTFRGLVPDSCWQGFTRKESTQNWKRNFKADGTVVAEESLFVAETRSHGVVGFALATETSSEDPFATQFPHELRSLQVHPSWQKQGVGRLLVAQVASTIWQNGETHVLVKVLKENPNVGFYERLGAVFLAKRPYTWLDFQTEEFIYGWENIQKSFVTNSL